ncbi:MAG: TIGR03617 family F420-dependent LLM class oxidoreductase [Candidatus Binatia bacterium]
MKIDAPLLGSSLAVAAGLARSHEAAGFDGVFTFDGPHDPFSSLALAAEHTDLDIATGVAIALARSPMTVAQVAHDLQSFSGGRFTLGLGSQVRAHVEHRFSMSWTRPVSRMKEFVAALRAIFACWNDDAPLRFEGEFYSHTLMPPLLRPSPCEFGAPPILLAGVGRAMLEAAGEVADGCVLHPFHSQRYLDVFALPAIAAGRERRSDGPAWPALAAGPGRPIDDAATSFGLVAQVLVVTGADDAEMNSAREAVRAQIAFYASTPAYRPVLEAEGNGDLQVELRSLTKQGRWSEMSVLVDDAMLERFAVVGTPGDAGRELRRRYAGVATRVAIATPMLLSEKAAAMLVAAFHKKNGV